MPRQVPCEITPKQSGWWLTFNNPDAGLLLDTTEEKLKFLIDCGIQVIEVDLNRLLKQIHITECPIEYYDRGCQFSISFE